MAPPQLKSHACYSIFCAPRCRRENSKCAESLPAHPHAARLRTSVAGTIASVTHSEYAVWLNWPLGPESLVAETEGFRWQARCLSLCDCVPRLSNDLDPADGVRSMAAAPIMFRSSVTGVLAVVNGAHPTHPPTFDLLNEIGRTAVLEHESLERAEALGLTCPRQRTADLVHGLRQPLGILEACAFYLDLVLPVSQNKAREQLAEMQRQLVRASGILDESAQDYALRDSDPGFEATEPAEEESRVRTNSAMSMVT